MKFLYRFELLEYDAALQDGERVTGQSGTVGSAAGVAHTLFTHTNFEQQIALTGDTLSTPFLPRFAMAGGSSTVYSPLAIRHSGLRLDGEAQSGTLDVTLPRDHPVAAMYAYDAPSAQVWLTLAVLHDATAEPQVVWVGRVRGADFDEQMCKLSCTPIQDVLARQALTKRYPRTCGHQLYDASSCGINRTAIEGVDWGYYYFKYREDGFVSARSADGFILTVPAAAHRPDGFFRDGFVVIDGQYSNSRSSGSTQHYPREPDLSTTIGTSKLNGGIRRSILGHVGEQLDLLIPLPPHGVEVGMRVSVFKGCNQTKTMCKADFNNIRRHGGYPFIPLKNIFENTIKPD